ncbi:hypothetical protein [Pseudomonas zeae]|uniref:hypothetical protein n=1 Tax=Pseudomonas zeae TaxID=2745510 RepID=UPI0039E18E71
MVNTQGRLYTLDLLNHSRHGTTTTIRPLSALAFTDKALEKFRPHPLLTLLGFKRFAGQYWTISAGDVFWSSEHVAQVGSVLHIKDIEIRPIASKKRALQQSIKIYTRIIFDLAMLGFLLAVTMFSSGAIKEPKWWARLAEYCFEYSPYVLMWLSFAIIIPVAQATKAWGAATSPFDKDLAALGLAKPNQKYAPGTNCLNCMLKKYIRKFLGQGGR